MYRQYTHCVEPADYVDNTPPAGFWNVIASLGMLPAWVATGCDYLLGGKLVCLDPGGTWECAIGRITKFEPPSSKSFPQNFDNDYSLSIVLAPHGLTTNASYLENYNEIAKDGLQGRLIAEQTQLGMPMPRESGYPDDDSPPDPLPSDRFQGYVTKYPDSNYPTYDPSHSPFQVDGSDGHPFWVPVLHLECEGSRIHDVCSTITTLQGPVGPFCEVPIIGWLACFLVDLALLPIMLVAAAIAWAEADDGDYSDVEVAGSGTLKLGDLIITTGRWVYDAGHQGWNEFHPVTKIQLIPEDAAEWGSDFEGWRDRWCTEVTRIPPFSPPGTHPQGMTGGQALTYTAQTDPSNQWVFHPLVDGCNPQDPPPDPLH